MIMIFMATFKMYLWAYHLASRTKTNLNMQYNVVLNSEAIWWPSGKFLTPSVYIPDTKPRLALKVKLLHGGENLWYFLN